MKKQGHFLLIIGTLIISVISAFNNFFAETLTTLKLIMLTLLLMVATVLTYTYAHRYPSDKKIYSLVGIIVMLTVPLILYATFFIIKS